MARGRFASAIIFFILVILPTWALDTSKSITQYMHRHWNTEDGLPQGSITCILQTRDGFLWFGTQEGLARFDGIEFQVYNKANVAAFRNDKIHTLCQRKDGTLWVGSEAGLVVCDLQGNWLRPEIGNVLPGQIVHALHEDATGNLWIGTDRGLLRSGPAGISLFSLPQGLAGERIQALAEDAAGKIWVSCREGNGLRRFQDNGFVNPLPKFSDRVISMHHDRSDKLWLGTERSGLWMLDGGKLTVVSGIDERIQITAMAEDRDGIQWLASLDDGLFRLRNDRWEKYNEAKGLERNSLLSLWLDREGSLWLGTAGDGVVCFSDGKFWGYGRPEGLPVDHVISVLEDKRGDVWLATDGGGLCRLHGPNLTVYTSKDGLISNYVHSLAEDRRGRIFIGLSKGLCFWQDGQIKRFPLPEKFATLDIFVIRAEESGQLWLGTEIGLLQVSTLDNLVQNISLSLAGQSVRVLAPDGRGGLWIGTFGGGLVHHEQGRFLSYSLANRLSSDRVSSLYQDAENVLWIGTPGSGLNRMADSRITTISSRNGLYDDTIHSILEDRRGNLWMSTNRGVFQVSKRMLNDFARGSSQRVNCRVYGEGDGLRSRDTYGGRQPAAWQARNGWLLYPTTKGVAIIDPENIALNTNPPPVYVENLKVDNVVYRPWGKVIIPPGQSQFQFEYVALSYLGSRAIRFQYKLEGFDGDWLDAGNRRTAYYTRIPPGRYTFRVIACNQDGIWNERGAALNLRVQPFFYQTALFYLGIFLLLVVAVGLGYRWRLLRLRMYASKLARQVREGTEKLRQEKERAENALYEAEIVQETLFKTNMELQQANELKSDLLHIAAHDLKNPLQGIVGMAEILKRETTANAGVQAHAETIAKAAMQMFTLINEILESAHIESGNLELKQGKVDLDKVVQVVVYENQTGAAEKGQTFRLVCDEGCFMYGDWVRIKEVVGNLVDNAIKFSPGGTAIEVRVKRNSGKVRIEVQDQGPGLTAADKKKIFGKFQRLSNRPTGSETTTGLGLSIAKQLVELHRGRIWVESETGQGCLFIVEFPLLAKQ